MDQLGAGHLRRAPFGGFKQSGLGKEHGTEALDYYTETKSVVVARSSMRSASSLRLCAKPVMNYKAITFDLSDRIATITFNRPDRLNAINEEMRDDFTRLFTELQTNEDIGVVIFTGAGRAFPRAVISNTSNATGPRQSFERRIIGSLNSSMSSS